jgi:type IV pilus assembly protein PilM
MPLGAGFRSQTVGLDIGSSAVKAVALRQGRSGWSLIAAGEAPVPPGGMQDGAAADPESVSDAIRQVVGGLRMRRARVTAAVSGHAVIVKRLSLPAMSQGELVEAIPWEAEQYIPFDLADVQLDFQVINAGTEAAKSSLDVLLVAAKKDRIQDRTAVITRAGQQPVVLDIEAFAVANAYQMNYPERSDPLAAIVHIGRSATIVCLLEHGQLAFTRDIPLGGRLYAETLQHELGTDAATAERIQRGQVPSEVSREQVGRLLRDVGSQVVLEIRKTIDFYRTTAPIEKLSRVVLSGGAWEADGLIDLLAAEFGAPVDVLDPFRRVTRPKGSVGAEIAGPAYAVAVGLAMRREGDR